MRKNNPKIKQQVCPVCSCVKSEIDEKQFANDYCNTCGHKLNWGDVIDVMDDVIYTNKNKLEFRSGDVFDIQQTVNGCSEFIILGVPGDYEVRYVINGVIGRLYEYDVEELLETGDDGYTDPVIILRNIVSWEV